MTKVCITTFSFLFAVLPCMSKNTQNKRRHGQKFSYCVETRQLRCSVLGTIAKAAAHCRHLSNHRFPKCFQELPGGVPSVATDRGSEGDREMLNTYFKRESYSHQPPCVLEHSSHVSLRQRQLMPHLDDVISANIIINNHIIPVLISFSRHLVIVYLQSYVLRLQMSLNRSICIYNMTIKGFLGQ